MILAAPHPATELVQLSQAEAISPFDQHDRGVGHVNAHLHHGRGNQDVQLPLPEGVHDYVFLVGAQATVQQAQAQIGEDLALQALVLGHGGLGLQEFRLLDERADDEGLAAGDHFLADKGVSSLLQARGEPVGLDLPAARRQLVQDGDVQVAVDGQG